ncbi:MAG: hypothetical protein JHD16_11855, partial [Solirubrobacteraceae bacterium]|nr:hypothetical protein [Solirubrobacteraceae bacterium]
MFNDQPASAAPDAPAEAPASDVPTAEGGASAEQLEQLLVLSQAPLSLDEAPVEETQRAESGPEAALATGSVMPLMAQYVRLLVQMLGVGMITATVRHYGDNPKLYLGLALGGALMFAVASTLLDRRPAGGSLLSAVRYGVLSAVLATGLGLLIGGVLHFTAFPKTAAVLVPLGLGLSIAAFVLRDGQQLMGRSFISTGVTIVG